MPQSRQKSNGNITSLYETDRAIVRLSGVVEVDSILALCDEVDLALDYYQYPTLELQIASPGGEVAALDYYLQRLHQWRSPPVVRIETRALTQAMSAAAIMLSLGDIGYRHAYASSVLLYHDPRIPLNEQDVTRAMLVQISNLLDATERRMLDCMVDHIWKGALSQQPLPLRLRLPDSDVDHEINSPEDLRAVYAALNLRGQVISPAIAKSLYLIDEITV